MSQQKSPAQRKNYRAEQITRESVLDARRNGRKKFGPIGRSWYLMDTSASASDPGPSGSGGAGGKEAKTKLRQRKQE